MLSILIMQQQAYIGELDQCADLVAGNFSPDGKSFVAADHGGGFLSTYSFPKIEEIDSLNSEDLFNEDIDHPNLEDDYFDYFSSYLSNKLILAKTRFGRLLLIDSKVMQCEAELMLEEIPAKGYNMDDKPTNDPNEVVTLDADIYSMSTTSHNTLFVTHQNGDLYIYQLPITV